MRIRASVSLYTLVLVALTAACGRGDSQQPPVATPTVTLNKDRAAIGSPLKITYKFDVSQKIGGDYWVFVHVLDQNGESLWGDDHQPPTPTSAWTPGQTVEYTRTIFVPNYPYIGPATIRLGLYMPSSGERLTLAGNDVSRREYLVGQMQILPQSENVFLIYKEGWHPAETAPQDPSVEWQWTRKAATISFRNPKKDSTLYLKYDARTDLFSPPQQVTVKVGDQVVNTFTADSRDPNLITMPITASQLGADEVTELVLEVDKTFKPGGTDNRELGIRVFQAFLEPRG